MSGFHKVVVALLAIISIGVWGITIFFFTTSEDSVPIENHALNLTRQVDKEPFMYKNKQYNGQNLKDLELKFNKNRVSIDELLAAITQEE